MDIKTIIEQNTKDGVVDVDQLIMKYASNKTTFMLDQLRKYISDNNIPYRITTELSNEEFLKRFNDTSFPVMDMQFPTTKRFTLKKEDKGKEIMAKALLWFANYVHYGFEYMRFKHNIAHYEKLTVEKIIELYQEYNKIES